MSRNTRELSSLKIRPCSSSPEFNSMYSRINQLIKAIPSLEGRLDHGLFYVKCGQLQEEYKNNFNVLNNASIDNSENTEVIIKHMEWPIDDKYFQYVSEKWLETFFDSEIELSELKEIIQKKCSRATDCVLNELIETTSNLWEELGISQEEATKYSLALNFYTDCLSEESNRLLLLEINKAFVGDLNLEGISREYHLINSYIIKGLKALPSYWGYCNRCCNVNQGDLSDYVPGNSVVWVRFSSSTLGTKPCEFASNRNTQFIIYSLTGKHIKSFSKFQNEDEVLFMPFTQFLIHKRTEVNNKIIIYMRQIELGVGIKNILWVDDMIFMPTWENKSHMETVARINKEIKFIPKSSTKTAIAFLKSIWGAHHKNNKENKFRIITDMNRPNEKNPSEAGALFIKKAIELGFSVPFMIFTSSENFAKNILIKHQINNENILVTLSTNRAIQFMLFN
ncbi:hypothetical protein SteCoe_3821 [Stentor coeruleus]|uniref:NAD(P)(+)--arginine ADP-ribosyltransferase n=1 Tax=Stentor coeruleus TaxID=5963 RepID=A0A1R2CW82_9CILI|nr:hypothetical protein SteCoe_3821 [Stentor coeruleus]